MNVDSSPGGEPAIPVSDDSNLVQLLTPEGERVSHPDYSIDISAEELRSLYRDLVLVRRIDNEATALQRQGELGLWAPLQGQEAAQVGSGRALRDGDFAFPTYREHGVAWTRGVPPLNLLKMFRGVDYGGWDPIEYGFQLYTIVIPSQTLHATGYALGMQRDGAVGEDGNAVIAYFGDGATSQGDIHEAFVWASANHAPVVFFCQNNHWAISAPLETQTRNPIAGRAAGYGFPGVRVDGNDILAVLAVTREALRRAREGEGPTLIEAVTYRMGAHTTSDDPTRYRLEVDVEHWRLKDPIARVKAYLVRNGLADEAFFAEIDAEADVIAAELREGCVTLPNPAPITMFDEVYAGGSPLLDEQRAEFAAYHASFADASQGH